MMKKVKTKAWVLAFNHTPQSTVVGTLKKSHYLTNFLFSFFAKKYEVVKFIYSEKATNSCEIFPLLLTAVHTVKGKGKISQNFVTFSGYMNFIRKKV